MLLTSTICIKLVISTKPRPEIISSLHAEEDEGALFGDSPRRAAGLLRRFWRGPASWLQTPRRCEATRSRGHGISSSERVRNWGGGLSRNGVWKLRAPCWDLVTNAKGLDDTSDMEQAGSALGRGCWDGLWLRLKKITVEAEIVDFGRHLSVKALIDGIIWVPRSPSDSHRVPGVLHLSWLYREVDTPRRF